SMLRLRDDGVRAGAAGLGLGLAASIGGILSASIGALVAGAAIASACAAMLIVQVALSRMLAPGFPGTLPVGLLVALIAAGTQQLALLPWYALPLLLLVPLAAAMPVSHHRSPIVRATILAGYALAASALPIGAAGYAAPPPVHKSQPTRERSSCQRDLSSWSLPPLRSPPPRRSRPIRSIRCPRPYRSRSIISYSALS